MFFPKGVPMKFQKCRRNAKEIPPEWRLASVDEVKNNLQQIKDERILDSWDIARLLDGWVDGPGYRYNIKNEYKAIMGHMLLVKSTPPVIRRDDGKFAPEIYSGVELNAEGRKAALLLSCEDKITEVICFVLHSILESFQAAPERQAELDRLTACLKDEFRNSRTVLHYAADQPHNPEHAEFVADLLQREFEYGKELIKVVDKYGRTALHFAGLHGNIRLCNFLLQKCEMNADERDRNGENLLHFAVNSNKVEVVKRLCRFSEVRSIIFSHDTKGKTPLHKAAANGNKEMIAILQSQIKDKAEREKYICRADLLGQTSLHEAASGGHTDAVKFLLESGSSPFERNSDAKTALHYGVQVQDKEKAIAVAELLLNKCSSDEERTLLLWASATGIGTAEESAKSSREVQAYLKRKKEETAGSTKDLLRSAIKLGYENMAWELINRGAKTHHITTCSGSDWSENERQRVENFLERIKKMPERGRDQPSIDDSLGRKAFAEGLAALFLNPYVKTPVTVGISGDWGMGKSSLMIQTELILLKAAAQLAFPNLLQTEMFPGSKQFELSATGQIKYQKIKKGVEDLLPRSTVKARHDEDPLLNFLDHDYQHKYHDVYRSLAVMDRSEMFHVKDEPSDSNTNRYSLGKIPTILTVRYNAWHYQNELEAWAGLAVQITKAIEETMTRAQRIRCRWRYAWKEQRDKIYLELFLPCFLAFFLSCWVAWGVWMLLSRSKQKELSDLKYGSIPVTVLVVVWAVLKQLLSVLKPISVQIMGYVRLPDHSSNLGYQHQVISDIQFLEEQMGEKPSWLWKFIALEWLWKLCGLYPDTVQGTSIPKSPPPCKDDVRIIVFVDDLDRCQDTVILQVLSAVNLVLTVCEINVILGMDKQMIATAIANKFQDRNNPQSLNPRDLAHKYISKIVQIPLALPDADDVETKTFLDQQLGVAFNGRCDEGTNSRVAQQVGCVKFKGDSDADSNSNVEQQSHTEGRFGDSQSLPDGNPDHLTLDVAQNVKETLKVSHLKDRLRKLINSVFRCRRGSEVTKPKLRKLLSMPLYSLIMMMPNYGYEEREAMDYLRKLTTDAQKLPREWKRFLTYHCLAWNILSQSEQVKKWPGWQVQLLVWIFCCWQWQDQINVIIENWKELVVANGVSVNDDLPSLRNIVEHYVEEMCPANAISQEQKKEEGNKEKEEGEKEKEGNKEKEEGKKEKEGNKENEEGKKEKEGKMEKEEEVQTQDEEMMKKKWNILKGALVQYDVSMECIQSFQKFRLHCDIGHLQRP